MRAVISLLVIVYLVGVGVVLAPTIRNNWATAPVSQLVAEVSRDLPRALAWPMVAYHNIMAEPAPART